MSMYHILCSYPETHVVFGSSSLEEVKAQFAAIEGQIDPTNYYWVEIECEKHGWQQLTSGGCIGCEDERQHPNEVWCEFHGWERAVPGGKQCQRCADEYNGMCEAYAELQELFPEAEITVLQ